MFQNCVPESCYAVTADLGIPNQERVLLQSSCLQSVSVGWDGGVYVQTCGHTLHIDCHKSYMESLRVICVPLLITDRISSYSAFFLY